MLLCSSRNVRRYADIFTIQIHNRRDIMQPHSCKYVLTDWLQGMLTLESWIETSRLSEYNSVPDLCQRGFKFPVTGSVSSLLYIFVYAPPSSGSFIAFDWRSYSLWDLFISANQGCLQDNTPSKGSAPLSSYWAELELEGPIVWKMHQLCKLGALWFQKDMILYIYTSLMNNLKKVRYSYFPLTLIYLLAEARSKVAGGYYHEYLILDPAQVLPAYLVQFKYDPDDDEQKKVQRAPEEWN